MSTIRRSATLCPASLRDLLVESVCCRREQPQQQNRRASLGKTHHLPISRPASCRFSAPDIRSRLVTSARPPPQHHLAGSLFATRFCLMLPPDSPFLEMPLACWRRPSVRKRRTIMFPTSSETAACASCQAHVKFPAQRAGLSKTLKTNSSSETSAQDVAGYSLEQSASEIRWHACHKTQGWFV